MLAAVIKEFTRIHLFSIESINFILVYSLFASWHEINALKVGEKNPFPDVFN